MSLAGVVGAILAFGLLHNPVQATAVTIPSGNNVTLAWNSSSSPTTAGYRIYYGATSRNYTSSVEAGNATTNTLPGLVSGVTYYFSVRSYDVNGLESTYSDEVSFVPGTAALQISVTASGQAMLTVSGLVGHTYDIQATADLQTWTNIGSVTMGTSGSLNYTDTAAPNFPKRFYRTRDILP